MDTGKKKPDFSFTSLLLPLLFPPSFLLLFSTRARQRTSTSGTPAASCALSWLGLLRSSAWSTLPQGSAGATRVNAPAPNSLREASTRITKP